MRFFLDQRLTGCAALAVTLATLSACDGDRGVHELAPTSARALSPVQPASAPQARHVKRNIRIVSANPSQSELAARPSLRAAYIQAIQASASAPYAPRQSGSELVLLENPRHGLHAELQSLGARFLVETGEARHHAAFRLTRYGCSDAKAGAKSDGAQAAVRPVTRDGRVVFVREAVTEWYKNGPLGVEQGFDLAARPACTTGDVALEMDVDSDLTPSLVERGGETFVELRSERGQSVLRYSDLSAFDADGKTLPARMTLAGRRLALSIDDRDARYPLHVDPLIWAQIKNVIQADSPVANDGFGTSIAVSGSMAIVGAPFNDGLANNNGTAFTFTRTMAGQWTQQNEFVISADNEDAHVGQAVAITDVPTGMKRAVVGAPDDGMSGTVSIFLFDGTNWISEDTIAGPSATAVDKFGAAVAAWNDRVIVGGPAHNGNDGYVAIFEKGATTFTQVSTATGATGLDEQLGFSVAIEDRLALAGAPFRTMTATMGGGYEAYFRDAAMATWTGTDSIGSTVTNAQSGYALATSGGKVLSGSPGDSGMGAAAVDTFSLTTGMRTASAPLSLPNGTLATGDMFGSAVAIDGTVAVVGAAARNSQAGDAFVFENMGGTWTYKPPAVTRKMTAMNERFGHSVAVNGAAGMRFIVVGAPGNDTTAAKSGAFYDIIERKGNGDSCAADSQCASDFCIDGVCCNSACGRPGAVFGSEPKTDCQSCLVSDTGVSDGTCAALNIRMQCRAATDVCDRASFCQTGNLLCPTNPRVTAGTLCRAASATNLCDAPEVCDGVNATCPADSKRGAGTVCRAAIGACDAAETCDGTADTCPADVKQNAGTPCRMAAAGDLCDVTEVCDGTAATCPADAVLAAGTACRMPIDDCDIVESCDGASKGCPFDSAQADGIMCKSGTCQLGLCRDEADLELALSANPPTTSLMMPITITATVQNRGLATALQVEVRISSNDGAALSNVMGAGWTCAASGSAFVCTRPELSANTAANITATLTPPQSRKQFSVSSLASTMTYDPETGNNSATVVLINDNPQSPVLSGGGFGCAMSGNRPTATLPGIFALALLSLIRRRRRAL